MYLAFVSGLVNYKKAMKVYRAWVRIMNGTKDNVVHILTPVAERLIQPLADDTKMMMTKMTELKTEVRTELDAAFEMQQRATFEIQRCLLETFKQTLPSHTPSQLLLLPTTPPPETQPETGTKYILVYIQNRKQTVVNIITA